MDEISCAHPSVHRALKARIDLFETQRTTSKKNLLKFTTDMILLNHSDWFEIFNLKLISDEILDLGALTILMITKINWNKWINAVFGNYFSFFFQSDPHNRLFAKWYFQTQKSVSKLTSLTICELMLQHYNRCVNAHIHVYVDITPHLVHFRIEFPTGFKIKLHSVLKTIILWRMMEEILGKEEKIEEKNYLTFKKNITRSDRAPLNGFGFETFRIGIELIPKKMSKICSFWQFRLALISSTKQKTNRLDFFRA